GELRIVDAFRGHDAANTERGQRQCALTPQRLIEVFEEDVDQLLQDLTISALDRIAAAHDIRWQSDQRATGFVVVEVVLRKIGVNNTLAARLASRSLPGSRSPRFGRIVTKEPANGLGIELVLVAEVPIKPSVREASVLHDFVDGDIGKPLLVEQAPRAFEDFLVRIVLVLS